MKRIVLFLLLSIGVCSAAAAEMDLMTQDAQVIQPIHRADTHAPIGVMGDHTHHEGEWMFSYRYMLMQMNESLDGEDAVSDNDVLKRFMITPQDMTMQMHMIGVMFAPSDGYTLMAMFPILRKDMNHINRAGVEFRTNSEGLGDIRLSGLVPFWQEGTKRLHANVGLSLPTGSINQIDDTPLGKGKRLPYPMQLGSGTWDFLPGITFNETLDGFSWGAQVNGIVHPGRNQIGYSLGDELEVQSWAQLLLSKEVSIGTKIDFRLWSNIDGRDPSLNPSLIPTADPKERGGKRIDLGFSLNWYPEHGWLAGNRIGIEVDLPIFQNLDGPQLSTDWSTTVGWQKSF